MTLNLVRLLCPFLHANVVDNGPVKEKLFLLKHIQNSAKRTFGEFWKTFFWTREYYWTYRLTRDVSNVFKYIKPFKTCR